MENKPEYPQELLNKRWSYYMTGNNNLIVKYELLKAMKNREVVLMDYRNAHWIIRGLFIRSIESLNYILNSFFFKDRAYNIYVSVAQYSFIPPFTFNLKNRSEFTSKWFAEESKKAMIGFDLFLDFDNKKNKNIEPLLEEVQKTIDILNNENLIYNIYPSGTGIQINVKTNIPHNENNYTDILNNFKERFDLETLDTTNSGTSNKFRKCEYSLALDRVILPIRDFTKQSFNYNDYQLDTVLKTVDLQNRGLKYIGSKLFSEEHIKKWDLLNEVIIE